MNAFLQHARASLVGVLLLLIATCWTQSLSAQKILEMMDEDHVVFKDVQLEAQKYFDVNGTGKGSGYKLFKRWEWRNSHRVMEDGRVQSKSRLAKILDGTRSETKNGTSDWEQLGPTAWTTNGGGYNPGVGRITAVAVEPVNQQVIYVGSPSGGLWKTTNGGVTWTPLGDQYSNMDIWAIAIDPNNNNTVYYGNGIGELWKSTNAGASFTLVDDLGSSRITTILIHPTNANIIHCALRYNGLFRTTNGGTSWTEVVLAGMEDVVYKPGSTTTMYACGSTFYKSTDGGATFSQITSGFQSTARMKLAVTPANSNYVYVCQSMGSGFGYLYRSTNSGTSFTTQVDHTTANYIGSQASRDMAVAVSTSNANEVHIGGLDMYVSTNGGTSFSQECDWYYPSTTPGGSSSGWSYVHADIEVMQYLNGNLFVGSDGGIFKSTNAGDDFVDLSFGLGVTQFYRINSAPTDPYRVIGGTQDNGTSRSTNSTFDWLNVRGADGMDCAIHPTNANILFGCIQYGGMFKSVNGGSSTTSMSTPPENSSGGWVTPIAIDPSNGNRIYAGYSDLYRNDNQANSGSSWTNVSTNVTWSGNLKGIEACPSNSNVLYIFVSGTAYRSGNILTAAPTWTTITGFTGSINDIAVDTYDENHVLVCTSSGRLYESFDGLATKTEIQSGLPSVAFISCVLDRSPNNGMYVAIDGAVYFKNSTLPSWVTFNTNLPKVDIDEIELYYGNDGTKKVRVGTYGRGLWQSHMYDEADGVGPTCATTITSFPYVENFDAQALCGNTGFACIADGACGLNGGWENASGDDGDWSVDDLATPSGNTGPAADHTSGTGKYMFTEASSCYSKTLDLVSPCLDLTGVNSPRLEFWYHMWGAGTGSLTVQVSTDAGASWSPSVWTLSGDQGNNWIKATSILTGYGGQTIRLRFRGVTGGQYTSDIAIDDVNVFNYVAPCNPPGGLSVSNISSSSATLNFPLQPINATNYDLRYRVSGTSTWTNISNVTGASRVLNALVSSTTYEWQIRSSCGTANSSYASGSNFTTLGASCSFTVSSFPNTQTFDGQTLCGNTLFACIANGTCALNGGWVNSSRDDADWSVDDANTPSSSTGPTTDHTSGTGKYMFTESSSCYYTTLRLLSPCYNLSSASSVSLSFWYHMYGATTGSLSVEVSTNAGTSWSSSVWSLSGDQGNSWQEATVNLDSYAGQTIMLRFTGVTGTSYTSDIAIDDVTMDAASCPTIDFNVNAPISYGGTQDNGTMTVQDGGATVFLQNNAWKAINYNYTVTANTFIEFDFRSTIEGEIHGIGFDNDNGISSNYTFKVHGTQGWGFLNYDNYVPSGWTHYTIPVGTFYTGVFNRLTFTADHDGGASNGNAYFRNVQVYEGSCGPVAPPTSGMAATPIIGTESELKAISVYPNPFGDFIWLDLPDMGGMATVSLYDAIGKKVWEAGDIPTGKRTPIKLNLANGVYVMRIQSGTRVEEIKVVKAQ